MSNAPAAILGPAQAAAEFERGFRAAADGAQRGTCPDSPSGERQSLAFQQGFQAGAKARRMREHPPDPAQMHDPRLRWVTREHLLADSLELAARVPANVGAVIGIPRSGLQVAATIATLRNLPLYAVMEHCVVNLGGGRRARELERLERCQAPRAASLLVDDSVCTGAEMERAVDVCRSNGFDPLLTAAVYVHPPARHKIDLAGRCWVMPHWFEWHCFGSEMVEKCAFDMDGMICQECPPEDDDDGPAYRQWLQDVLPRWLPRPHRVPLIITARQTRYEQPTRDWLARHGLDVQDIRFGPWLTKQERDRFYDPAVHKGAAFRRADCSVMFESCPRQAQRIAQASGKTVICPVSGEVFYGW